MIDMTMLDYVGAQTEGRRLFLRTPKGDRIPLVDSPNETSDDDWMWIDLRGGRSAIVQKATADVQELGRERARRYGVNGVYKPTLEDHGDDNALFFTAAVLRWNFPPLEKGSTIPWNCTPDAVREWASDMRFQIHHGQATAFIRDDTVFIPS